MHRPVRLPDPEVVVQVGKFEVEKLELSIGTPSTTNNGCPLPDNGARAANPDKR